MRAAAPYLLCGKPIYASTTHQRHKPEPRHPASSRRCRKASQAGTCESSQVVAWEASSCSTQGPARQAVLWLNQAFLVHPSAFVRFCARHQVGLPRTILVSLSSSSSRDSLVTLSGREEAALFSGV